MKAIGHFCTITRHKLLVMKHCFRVGLYRQGLLHDLSKYSWRNSKSAVSIIRETEVRIMQNVRRQAFPLHGCTTKGEISTIMNTGSIMVWMERTG